MPVDDVRKRTLEPPVIINMVIIVFYTAVTLWASWQLWKAAKAVGLGGEETQNELLNYLGKASKPGWEKNIFTSESGEPLPIVQPHLHESLS